MVKEESEDEMRIEPPRWVWGPPCRPATTPGMRRVERDRGAPGRSQRPSVCPVPWSQACAFQADPPPRGHFHQGGRCRGTGGRPGDHAPGSSRRKKEKEGRKERREKRREIPFSPHPSLPIEKWERREGGRKERRRRVQQISKPHRPQGRSPVQGVRVPRPGAARTSAIPAKTKAQPPKPRFSGPARAGKGSSTRNIGAAHPKKPHPGAIRTSAIPAVQHSHRGTSHQRAQRAREGRRQGSGARSQGAAQEVPGPDCGRGGQGGLGLERRSLYTDVQMRVRLVGFRGGMIVGDEVSDGVPRGVIAVVVFVVAVVVVVVVFPYGRSARFPWGPVALFSYCFRQTDGRQGEFTVGFDVLDNVAMLQFDGVLQVVKAEEREGGDGNGDEEDLGDRGCDCDCGGDGDGDGEARGRAERPTEKGSEERRRGDRRAA
ncbi:unnamed protein product [Diatraea saccharalis]|uniref:Uncharacterized protein n=1 Tax=Diatraea saccharalis TaxID=40085 RepID=A0A9N9R6E6_9NEOP|nr:unnamed protein product [Diatraea saccharalis]